MSLTNQQVINKALQELYVLESGQSPSSDESSDVLALLNQMMAEWAVSDKDLNFPPQDTLSDTCPIPTWAERGVIASLAIEAAPMFDAVISSALVAKYEDGVTTITRTLINHNLEKTDMSHLPQGQGYGYRYNIETDQ